MATRIRLGIVVIAVGAAAFAGGRASVDNQGKPVRRGSYAAGVRAGLEAAFSGFDGGWAFDTPYVVTLRRGGPGITYAFERRWPLLPGFEYRACGRGVCRRGGPH
ncbi:MAG: hypothetical protein QOH62_1927 [Solirubrobacteraceae bacterium]|jgi:hypothetical protein|nr:hypothetical protein [Solirubrobacteraceae bacterium]